MARQFVVAAAVLGALGVALGAFGAHGLEATLESNESIDTFNTASQYHMYHVLALIGVGWLASLRLSRTIRWGGYLLIVGILLFSGSLYGLAVFDIGILGAVAPLGGTALIIGWGCVGLAAWRTLARPA